MESKLNHDLIAISQEGNMSLTYYAFEKVHQELHGGKEVEDLKLKVGEEDKTSERGFRNFLMRMTSLNWDDSKITDDERASLNKILLYLSVPMETEPEPVVESTGQGIGDIIAQNQEAMNA